MNIADEMLRNGFSSNRDLHHGTDLYDFSCGGLPYELNDNNRLFIVDAYQVFRSGKYS
jgi:hypothetical protein